jgi:hypothetical protein
MATTIATTAVSTLTPPQSRQALNAECIGHILAGTPLPEGIAPLPYAAPATASVREGIERILGIAGSQVQ